ncbi:fibrillarin-like rRNA/tRNA 2'-O-methyltransferase [Candidatus Bathyarchaeota archaeon]|nr:fibrillarin-like rRNA/tRNA 2'-O-methyltransferase [Candidatus Bathyarchaeota archaeon]
MVIKVKPHPRNPAIYIVKLDGEEKLATLSLAPGVKVYDERVVQVDGKEYRIWNPYRSKLSAAIYNGLKEMPITPGCRVLYLGAASGTTVSHVSDIVGEDGIVYCVEFSARPMRELIQNVSSHRRNVVPILEDARLPSRYSHLVGEVNVIYCDVAQPEQAKILADNADLFLKNGGRTLLAVKARSIDVTKKPKEVYKMEVKVLEKRGFEVREIVNLEPYERDHALVLAVKK